MEQKIILLKAQLTQLQQDTVQRIISYNTLQTSDTNQMSSLCNSFIRVSNDHHNIDHRNQGLGCANQLQVLINTRLGRIVNLPTHDMTVSSTAQLEEQITSLSTKLMTFQNSVGNLVSTQNSVQLSDTKTLQTFYSGISIMVNRHKNSGPRNQGLSLMQQLQTLINTRLARGEM